MLIPLTLMVGTKLIFRSLVLALWELKWSAQFAPQIRRLTLRDFG